MFDLCWGWRRQLLRRADGELPRTRQDALENHLARCEPCRAYAETGRQADRMLRDILSQTPAEAQCKSQDAFEDAVLAALNAKPATATPLLSTANASHFRCPALNLGFVGQIMGGALAATALTIVCILPALHPANASTPAVGGSGHDSHALSENNAPPVPLESLLRSAAPRAALMWTVPAPRVPPSRTLPAPDFTPARSEKRPSSAQPERHGKRESVFAIG